MSAAGAVARKMQLGPKKTDLQIRLWYRWGQHTAHTRQGPGPAQEEHARCKKHTLVCAQCSLRRPISLCCARVYRSIVYVAICGAMPHHPLRPCRSNSCQHTVGKGQILKCVCVCVSFVPTTLNLRFRAKFGHFASGHSTGHAKSGHFATQPRTLRFPRERERGLYS